MFVPKNIQTYFKHKKVQKKQKKTIQQQETQTQQQTNKQ
jgi:hypothetical protein